MSQTQHEVRLEIYGEEVDLLGRLITLLSKYLEIY